MTLLPKLERGRKRRLFL